MNETATPRPPMTSHCHDAPVRKLNNGKMFCQVCGKECEPVIQEQLPLDDVPKG